VLPQDSVATHIDILTPGYPPPPSPIHILTHTHTPPTYCCPHKDVPTRDAVTKYLNYLLKEGDGAYGILVNTITTGMAGIAVADAVEFGASYSSSAFDAF
jgi:hypothetical protein